MDEVLNGKFYARLETKIKADCDEQQAIQLIPFAKRVFELFPLEELLGENLNDLVGFVRRFWLFMQQVDPNQPKVQIFNPAREKNGWAIESTAIFVVQRDMPFLVDSVRMELNRRGLNINTVNTTIFTLTRDEENNLLTPVASEEDAGARRESTIFLELDEVISEEERRWLEKDLYSVLYDVAAVTDDYYPMMSRVDEVVSELQNHPAYGPGTELDETINILEWLKNGNFTFTGYAEYRLGEYAGESVLSDILDRKLGIFRRYEKDVPTVAVNDLNPGLQAFYNSDMPLIFTKSSVHSRVHRQAYSDYIVVKRFDDKGNAIGEHRFLGLYTSVVYNLSPFQIPLISKKVERIVENSDMVPGGHDDKALRQIIEIHPRDELFHSSVEDLQRTLMSIWEINERRHVRLFVRPDPFEKFISCIVYFPRDIYNTKLRKSAEKLLMEKFAAYESEFNTYFSESILARTHYILQIKSKCYRDIDFKEVEKQLVQLSKSWKDNLTEALYSRWGKKEGHSLFKLYGEGFSSSYQEHFSPQTAMEDIELFRSLESQHEIAMNFYQAAEADKNIMRFKLFHQDNPLELSELVPMLEHLGFRVLGEHPYQITSAKGTHIWLQDFTLSFNLDVDVDVSAVRHVFEEAFSAIWSRHTESDSFNRLVIGARLDWRTVSMLRMYARYMKQLGSAVSQDFIAETLSSHLDITRHLVALFKSYFDPKMVTHKGKGGEADSRMNHLNQVLLSLLDQVVNLNEDQVLRSYLNLINATLRTNFFQSDTKGHQKPYISVKLAPGEIPNAPRPRPLYEIFVYSPRIEGVHLRGGKVARGGLRWSDRLEDYRTEILGLVKAQQVKNSVIVPTGAKGGFVAKYIDRHYSREAMQKEGVGCYQLFIRGLLDLTDNVIDGEIVPPVDVVRRDDDDPYLVVAADKGTATFSDIANEISGQYEHWLGDAFASGGSNGYDHKAMGITAKGAWVAVQRHFRELGINTQTDNFSVIGIGDMGGDVFGNGMLMSECIELVAAFNHMHIFIDPAPDAGTSFVERKRLFETPGSSWADYDEKLISRGGGIFERSAKSVQLTPEIQQRFGIEEQQLTPTELIKRLLQSEVDLIWNGGIGTYIKARTEGHLEVGDRANDLLRIDGGELRCRVFGEGGNLGMTQKGRIEYCLNGGACNTDFIDNAAGVDCSDHEVNIKILLNELVQKGEFSAEQRNRLLEEMTEQVSELVLANNYNQTLAITLADYQCSRNLAEYARCISEWENDGKLDRALEGLPDDETIGEREKAGQSLVRPELSVLVSYAKIILKEALLNSDVADDQLICKDVEDAFPQRLNDGYPEQIANHSLRREIICNQIANEVINRMGLTFCQRQATSTGASMGEVVKAYVVVRDSLQLNQVWSEIESLDYAVSSDFQNELFATVMRLGRRATRWVLRNRRACLNPVNEIKAFASKMDELRALLASLLGGEIKRLWLERFNQLLERGVPEQTAGMVVSANNLYFGFGAAEIAIRTEKPLRLVAIAHHKLATVLQLHWFADEIVGLQPANRWEDFARESFVDDLEYQRRSLTNAILRDVESEDTLDQAITSWQQKHSILIARWMEMIKELRVAPAGDFAMYSVALRELLDLVQATNNQNNQTLVCPI